MKDFLQECQSKNILVKKHEPLNIHCSFKCGADAEYFAIPHTPTQLSTLLAIAKSHNIPITVLGMGSNVLPPDSTLLGLCISTKLLVNIPIKGEDTQLRLSNNHANFAAGISVRRASSLLANMGLRGLDFLYGMPGSLGGALWMNARCYGKEIADVLVSAKGIYLNGKKWTYKFKKEDFAYKKSFFQTQLNSSDDTIPIITECSIKVSPDNTVAIWQDMLSHEMDRHHKGHFIAPCAGSVFKNNSSLGTPSGQLLDALHWRAQSIRNAQVNPYHANMILNKGNAKSQDIYTLSHRMQKSVKEKYGYDLEHEIIFLGKENQWKH